MGILRDILFEKCDAIFINDNGDQVQYEGEGKIKQALEFMNGKELIPTSIEHESVKGYLADYETYETNIQGKFLYITMITYNHMK